MHLGKPLQRRVIVPRTETLSAPEAGQRPPVTEAEPAEPPATDGRAPDPSAVDARPAV